MAPEKARDLTLWITVLAGPVFWLISFQSKLSWNTWTCAEQTKAPLLLFAAVALVLTAGAGLIAYRRWRDLGQETGGEGGNPIDRSRFMAIGAITFSVGFCLVILAQVIPDLIIDPCQ